MPRPPIQHHKLIISLAPETLEALEDLQETFIKGKALRAAGEAVEGLTSHPGGLLLITTLAGALGLYIGSGPASQAIIDFTSSLGRTTEDQQNIRTALNRLRDLLPIPGI